ncbi:MAG TPA: acyltransferase domain-containing protein, partial [Thermoleophilaceae bacterium]
ALRAQARRLGDHLAANPGLDPHDVAHTLATARAQLERRAAVVGADRDALMAGLTALAAGEPATNVVEGTARAGRTAFLFTGQGAQRAGMGRELYERFPAFAEAHDAVLAEIGPIPDSQEELDRTEHAQAALFALEVALYRLTEALGLRPDYLIGHSIGEIAAAHVAGVLSLEDACRLVRARGELMGALPEGGAMLAIEAGEDELGELPPGVSLAAVNGPRGVVVSGDAEPIAALERDWRAKDRRTNRLRVSHAFHSHLMEPMLDEFRRVAETLGYAEPKVPIVSNLTGDASADHTDPDYWVRHVRETVRFADGVRFLEAQGVTRFIELGPDGVLAGLAAQTIEQDGALTIPLLRDERPEPEALTTALAAAHSAGAKVDWTGVVGRGRTVELPTYAFQRERYWLTPGAGRGDASALGLTATEHPLLATAVPVAGERDDWIFSGRLSLSAQPWLRDHAVLDTVILPGTGFVELALYAADAVGLDAIEELTLEAPLVVPERGAVQLQVTLGTPHEDGGGRELAVYARADVADDGASAVEYSREWQRHAIGVVGTATPAASAATGGEAWPPAGAEPLDAEPAYERLGELGFGYGPAFQGLRAAWVRGEELFAEVALPDEQAGDAGRFNLHPALLDSAFHAGLLAGGEAAPTLPFAWSGVRLEASGAAALRVRIAPAEGERAVTVRAVDPTGAPVLSIERLVVRPVDQRQLTAADRQAGGTIYAVHWIEAPAPSTNGSPPRLAVLGELPEPERAALAAEAYPDLDALLAALA